MKLIAYRIISELKFDKPLKTYANMLKADDTSLRIFCEALEDGEIFRNIGIVNLLEGDFFSWYSSPTQWNSDIAEHIRKLLQILVRYENASEVFKSKEAMDLFKRLYETIMPQVIRTSLGEFYTPSWLTEHVLYSVKPDGLWRGLDPCCGSGTFILTMIDAVLKETKHATKEHN
jgi:type I restriction-modification system DNA methylase subunit